MIRALPALLLAMLCGIPAAASGSAAHPRWVSLAPHLTELAYAAGAGDLLVGASAYSDFPAAARHLPRIGDAQRVDRERLLALRPDLVLAWGSGTSPELVAWLNKRGIRVETLEVRRLEEIPVALELLGRWAGKRATASAAAAEFRQRLSALKPPASQATPVRVFIELDHQPLFTVTGAHLISEMVERCGGVNVFAGLPGLAPAVSLESVLAAAPEVILHTGPMTDPLAAWQRWPQVPAVSRAAVYPVPGDLVARPSVRALDGLEAICVALDRFRRIAAGARDDGGVSPSSGRGARALPGRSPAGPVPGPARTAGRSGD